MADGGLANLRRLDLRRAGQRHPAMSGGPGRVLLACTFPGHGPGWVPTAALPLCRPWRCRRKLLGVWKASSTRWLRDLVAGLEQRHAASGGRGPRPVVLWDEAGA